jgi:hypothetical protein
VARQVAVLPRLPVGHEAVEGGVVAVLCLVEDAVEPGHGLVREPAGGVDRKRLHRAVRVGGHLERVAVRGAGAGGRVALGRAVVEDLLAGDPGVPGRLPAGAVGVGAAEHREALLQPPLSVVLDDELGVPAPGHDVRVVPHARGDVDDDLSRAGAVLVVADQDRLSAATSVGRHPVEDPRRRLAVVHRLSLAGDDPVLEALRQVEVLQAGVELGRRLQRAVAASAAAALALRLPRGQRHQRTTERDPASDRRRTLDELPPGHAC